MKRRFISFVLAMMFLLPLCVIPASAQTTLTLRTNAFVLGLNEGVRFTPTTNSRNNIVWTVSDSSILRHNQDGAVRGVKVGIATLTATVDGVSAEVRIAVRELPKSISANNISVGVGQRERITIEFPRRTASRTRTFVSANPSIARVNKNGWVTGVSAGTTTVTVTVAGNVRTTVTVTVGQGGTATTTTPGQYETMQFAGNTWLILERQGNRALILSERITELRFYSYWMCDRRLRNPTSATWETSDLRRYLNDDYYNNNFEPEDKARILSTTISTPDNPEFKQQYDSIDSPFIPVQGGVDTTDRIFVLSHEEIRKYFGECGILETLHPRIAYDSSNTAAVYWTRTPGRNCRHVTVVTPLGSLNFYGLHGNTTYDRVRPAIGVRPAMWITLT